MNEDPDAYRAMLEASGDGFCLVELLLDSRGRPCDCRFVDVNPAFERRTGLADAAGRTLRELACDPPRTLLEVLERVLRTGRGERFDGDLATSDRLHDVQAVPIGAPDRRRLGLLLRDTRLRRHAGNDLRASEIRFRAFVTASSDVVYRMSPDWRQMHELDGQGFLADTRGPDVAWMDRYIHPDDRVRVQTAIDRAIASKSMFELEHRVRRADGSLGWTLSRAVPLLDETGEIREWLGAARDVTDRKRAETALRESEERHRGELERRIEEAVGELRTSRDLLEATTNASTDMIQVFEAVRGEAGDIVDFRWILNNRTSERIYGDVRDESLLERNPGVVGEGIFDAFRRVTQTGVPEQAERHYVHEQFDGWFYQSVVKLNDGVATTTKDITAWKGAQADVLRLQEEAARLRLRDSEERFRSFAENSTDVLWIVDARTRRLAYLSPAFERIWGESRERVMADLGRWADMVHPEDRTRTLAALPRAVAGGTPQITYRIVRPDDGRVRWIQDTGFPIRDSAGQIGYVGGISQDVTDQREMADRLRENERRLWTLVQGIPQLVWRADERGRWTWASPQWSAYTGQSEADSRGLGWLDAFHPDDRERGMQAWREADGLSQIDMDTRLFHAGERRYRWFQTRALPMRDETGRIVEWFGTSTDVDDMRQLQGRQQVLVAELQHRTRNLIGVVRAIADRTIADAASLADFLPRYRERLGALSRINGLLSKLEQGERVTFDDMIRTEFEARGVLGAATGGRLVLDGPVGVRLRSATVQTFALAIHELATNAVKYGALADERGRLSVRWRLVGGDDGERRLRVEWVESEVADMPASDGLRAGYGRELIEKALPYQLKATTTYELKVDGVRCTIDLPLD